MRTRVLHRAPEASKTFASEKDLRWHVFYTRKTYGRINGTYKGITPYESARKCRDHVRWRRASRNRNQNADKCCGKVHAYVKNARMRFCSYALVCWSPRTSTHTTYNSTYKKHNSKTQHTAQPQTYIQIYAHLKITVFRTENIKIVTNSNQETTTMMATRGRNASKTSILLYLATRLCLSIVLYHDNI